VLFIDLDHFKNVNDAHGHLAGDALLVQVAERLRAVMRTADTIARFGGDEFVVVCEDSDEALAHAVADRVADSLREPFEINGQRLFVTASVGIAVSPPIPGDCGVLLSNADAAMYEAKAHGRSRSRVFDARADSQWNQRLELTNELRDALSEESLEVHYQPVIDLQTSHVIAIEALVRWHHPTRGWVPPAVFVPLAEDGGFVSILDKALPQTARLAVNISAHGIADQELVQAVRTTAQAARLPLTVLELEVTETALQMDSPAAHAVLTALRDLGVGIALDDFGTGYSSLINIRELPVTTIKIDRTFVQSIASRPDDLAVVASVVELARAIGLRTVAEGVETAEQLALLRRLGCEGAQGYFWSKALGRDELAVLLKQNPGGPLASAATAETRRTAKSKSRVTNEHGLHRIVALHGAGGSSTTIAAALNADGFQTPKGLRWHSTTVSRVIRDLAHA
jgi:diguanylate cyclase (GGDEF)-like protein